MSDLEKDHPEIAYENSINSMIDKYTKLKKATAAIIRRREDIEGRLKAREKELAQVDADLNTAVESEEDELALILINKKNTLEAEVAETALASMAGVGATGASSALASAATSRRSASTPPGANTSAALRGSP